MIFKIYRIGFPDVQGVIPGVFRKELLPGYSL